MSKQLQRDYKKGDRNFANGDFRHANFSFQTLSQANFRSADLSHANLSSALLQDCDFTDANLSFANFSNANLTNANLLGSNLEGAILASAILRDASYDNNTTLPHGINLESYGAVNLDLVSPINRQPHQDLSTEYHKIDEGDLPNLESNRFGSEINQSMPQLETIEKEKTNFSLSSSKSRQDSPNHDQNDSCSSRILGFSSDYVNREHEEIKDFFSSEILLEGKQEFELKEKILRRKVEERFLIIEEKYRHVLKGIKNHKPASFESINHSLKLERFLRNGGIALVLLLFFQGTFISYILFIYLLMLLGRIIIIYRTNTYPPQYINEVKKLLKELNKETDRLRQEFREKIEYFKDLSIKPISYDFISQLTPLDRFFIYRTWHETCGKKYIVGDQRYVFEPVTQQYNQFPDSLFEMAIGVLPVEKQSASVVRDGAQIKVVLVKDPKPDYWILQDDADNFWLFPKKGWKPRNLTSIFLFGKIFKCEGLRSSHFKVIKPALATRASPHKWTLQEMGRVKFY